MDSQNELQNLLDEKKIFARRLVVEVAYHSHHMLNVRDEYERAIRKMRCIQSETSNSFLL